MNAQDRIAYIIGKMIIEAEIKQDEITALKAQIETLKTQKEE